MFDVGDRVIITGKARGAYYTDPRFADYEVAKIYRQKQICRVEKVYQIFGRPCYDLVSENGCYLAKFSEKELEKVQ